MTAAHVELAYATTVHGVQGETVNNANLILGETTGAASAYVAMTRGRHHNTAHLVADTVEDARTQWIETFTRDRADLCPAHATETAREAIESCGSLAPTQPGQDIPGPYDRHQEGVRRPTPPVPSTSPGPGRGIGR